MIDSPKEYSPEYILSALHIESYKPSPSQYSKIGMLHNTIVGHYGLERTLRRLKKLTDTIDIQTFHWSVCQGCKTMSMDWNFQHVHFLTTRTLINVISDMLSLIFPSIFQILETFKYTFKSNVANY